MTRRSWLQTGMAAAVALLACGGSHIAAAQTTIKI